MVYQRLQFASHEECLRFLHALLSVAPSLLSQDLLAYLAANHIQLEALVRPSAFPTHFLRETFSPEPQLQQQTPKGVASPTLSSPFQSERAIGLKAAANNKRANLLSSSWRRKEAGGGRNPSFTDEDLTSDDDDHYQGGAAREGVPQVVGGEGLAKAESSDSLPSTDSANSLRNHRDAACPGLDQQQPADRSTSFEVSADHSFALSSLLDEEAERSGLAMEDLLEDDT